MSIEKLEEIRISFFKDIDTQPIHKFYLIDMFMIECIDILKKLLYTKEDVIDVNDIKEVKLHNE